MRIIAIEYPVPSYGRRYLARLVILIAALAALVLGAGTLLAAESEEGEGSEASEDTVSAYIVKGASAERMAELVVEVGGKVTHELSIIRAVGAELTDAQRDTLAEHPEVVRIWRDREAKVQSAGQGLE